MASEAQPPLKQRLAARATELGNRSFAAAAAVWRIADRTLTDGFIHAGNLAYLSLVTLFPAVVLVHAFSASLGRTEAGQQAIEQFLRTLPADVAKLIAPVLDEVVSARSGTALAAGVLIALWTTSGFIGTLRDMLRRAHEAPADHPFWLERLLSVAITLAALALILVGFVGRVVVEAMLATVAPYMGVTMRIVSLLDIQQVTGMAAVFLALWALFHTLTPRSVKARGVRTWPGPLMVTLVWAGTTALIGPMMANAVNFSLTYGALAGVMLAMLFFYIIGFAVVAGAETNAALAKPREVAETAARWRARLKALAHGGTDKAEE
ncbi:MAG: YihY/virulence factor BrkB family protein [Sphingomonadaceae bacterium]